MNKPEFVTSNEICDTMKFSKRTLHRRLLSPENPLPQPAIKRIGAMSLWDAHTFYEWVERERQREKMALGDDNQGGGYE